MTEPKWRVVPCIPSTAMRAASAERMGVILKLSGFGDGRPQWDLGDEVLRAGLAAAPTPDEAVVGPIRALIRAASILQQNSEACAREHHGATSQPLWLADTAADIEAARAALASLDGAP